MRKSGHIFIDKHEEQRPFENLGLKRLYVLQPCQRDREKGHALI